MTPVSLNSHSLLVGFGIFRGVVFLEFGLRRNVDTKIPLNTRHEFHMGDILPQC